MSPRSAGIWVRRPRAFSATAHVDRGSVDVSRSVRTMREGVMPIPRRASTRAAPLARWSSNPMTQREPEPNARPMNTEMNATGRVIEERRTPRTRMIHRPVHPHLMAFIDWASPAEVKRAHRVTMTRLIAIAKPVWWPCVAIARSTLRGAVR